MSKKIGFFILFAAVVVDIVAVVLYGSAYSTNKNAYIGMVIAAVVGFAAAFGGAKLPKVCNWGPAVAAAAMAAGIAYSATSMADPIGFVISGLYDASTLTTFITFGAVACIALILFFVAGFTGVASEE